MKNAMFDLAVLALLCLLTLAAYIERLYAETGKFLSREDPENFDAWERYVQPRLGLGTESAATSVSILRQIAWGALVFLLGMHLFAGGRRSYPEMGRTAFELFLSLLVFDRLIPQLLFTRTRGRWIRRLAILVQLLFYIVLPVTLLIGLLLSIAGLAAPEPREPEHPGEAMDALLEAGEEEGILEESDRALVRSVVEFGDKVVREVMTPRPEMVTVPGTQSLAAFTATVNEHNISRVPVYGDSIDDITGIAFARDLLEVQDADASRLTVAKLQRAAAFVPETKKVSELLREMQRQKQHMSLVIDEYGAVAGLVTIEDLLEAIVGDIEDEHDALGAENVPVIEPDGAAVVPGSFEVSRLRDLLGSANGWEDDESENEADTSAEQQLAGLLSGYDATSVGGLVSEMAGHIPLPGEVIEDGPLRVEVLASSDRRVVKVRVRLTRPASESEPE